MVVGEVIRFDSIKGYGFARPDSGGEDVFLHVNDFDFDKHMLQLGARVQFLVEEGERGLKASRVRLVESEIAEKSPAPEPVHQVDSGAAEPSGDDDALCDVLTTAEFAAEITETVLHAAPGITAEQILNIRQRFLQIAQNHGWIEG